MAVMAMNRERNETFPSHQICSEIAQTKLLVKNEFPLDQTVRRSLCYFYDIQPNWTTVGVVDVRNGPMRLERII